MAREYKPFVIRVGIREAKGFPVRAEFQGTSWSTTIPASLPLLTGQEVRQALEWLERGFVDREYAKDFGSRLFRTLFQDAIREGFRTAYERVAPEDGLRIVLSLPRELRGLPWELMYDQDGEHGFLARSATTPLVRHFEDVPLPHEPPTEGPLRVLIVTASPKGYPLVSSEKEANAIYRSLTRRKVGILETLRLLGQHLLGTRSLRGFLQRLCYRRLVEIDVLPHVTRQKLQKRMVETRKPDQGYHVVHFIGHGQADRSGGQLLFEADADGEEPLQVDESVQEGKPDAVQADEFAEMVAEPTVNLAVLNACKTASTMGFFNGIAQATLKRGVPAVVGMQVPILDRAAVGFAREFYGAWAAGEPIEGALAYARRIVKGETPGAAADWGIPVLYMGPVKGLKLKWESEWKPKWCDEGFPGCGWRMLRWIITAFLTLLSTIALLLTIPNINRQLRTEVPVIRCVFPYPMESEGSFNVVLARFTVLDENGKRVGGKEGKALADYMFRNLAFNFEDLELDTSYEIRPPDHTCRLSGSTRAEREAAAAKLAERINADIIVYGVITDTGKQSRFSPEFYVNYRGFEEGDEITGQHEMGRELRVDLPFDAVTFSSADNPALSARAEALSLLTMGLAHYAIDDFEQALIYFGDAEKTEGWFRNAGKEVIYLLMGNAYVRWDSQRHCVENSDGHLEEAWSQFDAALEINPTYARAQIGLAGVLRQMALEGVFNDSFAKTNLDRLDEATSAYETAIHLGDPPESANIETKVHFGLGQVYNARFLHALVTGGDWSTPMSQARDEFEQVIGEYDGGNERGKNLAGHAHARLGSLARLEKDFETAVKHYTLAISLTTPYYQAYYSTRLGEVYVDEGQIELAIQAYDEAIAITEFHGSEECHRKFSARRDELRGANGGAGIAQRPQIIPGLGEELYFEGGGGGDAPICEEPSPGTPLPAIVVSDRLLDMGAMCLYGFDLGDQVTVELYGPPDDRFVASKAVTIGVEFAGRTEELIFLWWPVGLTAGTWQAVARSTGGVVQSSFLVPPHEYMRISTMPAGEIDPFEMHFCDTYQAGDEVVIHGANFPADTTFPVGVYQVTWLGDGTLDGTGSLVHGRSVTTDGDGYFVTSVTVGLSDLPGDYYVIAMLDPNVNRYRVVDAETGCYKVESE